MNNILKVTIIILAGLLLINPASAWYDLNYTYKIDNPISNGTRPFQIMINISNSLGTNNASWIYCNGHCSTNYSDLLFTLNNNTVLPFWIENTSSTNGKIWINLTANGTVNMYYGKSGAISASNGNTTFLMFSSGADEANWTNVVDNVNGELYFHWGGATASTKTINIQKPWVMEAKWRTETVANMNLYFMIGNGAGTSYGSNINNEPTFDTANTNWKAILAGLPSLIYNPIVISTYYIAKEEYTGTTHNHYLYTGNRTNLLGSLLGTTFGTTADANPITGMQVASGSAAYNINTYIPWIFIRRYDATIVWSAWGSETIQDFTICTPSTSSLTTNSVTISCSIAPITGTAWIQYGGYTNAYKFKSNDQTVSGTFSTTITGIPLMAGSTYYYKQMFQYNGTLYSSMEQSFTLPAVTQTVDYQFDAHTEDLAYADLNITTMAIIIPLAYTDIVGSIFWGIVFAFIFVMIWLRQEDISVPALLGLLIGGSIWGLMPAEWVQFAYSLVIVSFAGLMYSLIKSKS